MHRFRLRVLGHACAIVLLTLAASPIAAEDPDYSAELPRIAPTEPQDALKSIQIQPGYKIEQVAAEPLVASPVAVAWDERGRLFVVEMRGYSEHRAEKLSRIRILYDDDSDGLYDRAKVFADNLLWPTAIFPWEGGVFVADAPDILYLKDTDGDDIADVRQRVFTGFGTQNVQGLLNSFHWHFDNRIHGSASSNGGEITIVDKPNVKPISVRGRDFSFDPRTLDFRAESGGAQHGMTFDDYGRKFVSSNSDHIQQVMYEEHYAARNPNYSLPSVRVSIAADGPQAEVFRISPVEPWRIVRTRLRVSGAVPGIVEGGGRPAGYFTGATGVTIVRGSAFVNDPLYGMAVVGDVGSNLVHRKRLSLEGVRYAAHRVDKDSEFIASKDNWFRPAQFANGPDGGLYVIDVYREVIEHPASLPPVIKKHLDLDSGRDRGRLYRVAPESWKRPGFEPLNDKTTSELVELLGHENAWHRETAARLIHERQDAAAQAAILSKLKSPKLSPLARVHCLYALQGLGALDDDVLKSELRHDDARVREHAIRLAAARPDLADELAMLVDDRDRQVLHQLAFVLGSLPEGEKAAPLLKLLERYPHDPWLTSACYCSLGNEAAAALTALMQTSGDSPNAARVNVLKSLATVVARQDRDQLKTVTQSLLSDAKPLPKSGLTVLLHLEKQLRLQGKSLQVILDNPATERLSQILQKVIHDASATLDDAESPVEAKIAAVEALSLGHFDEVQPALAPCLSPQSPQQLQTTAMRTLNEFKSEQVATLLLEAWPGLGPQSRREATEVLLARPERSRAFVEAIASKQIAASEIDAAHAETLKRHADPKVREQAQALFATTARRADVVEQFRSSLDLKGDPERGKSLFAKHCASCHRVENAGHEVGPNLAAMKNRGPEAILVNVLDPNREVNPQFLSYVVLTADGRSLTGLIAGESATGVTLKRGEGQTEEVLRSNVEELRSTGLSLMPEGLERQLDAQALADLISYLMSLK